MQVRFVSGIAIVAAGEAVRLGPSADELRDEVGRLLEGNHRSILVDLSATQHMDSAGLGTLVAAFASAVRRGGVVSLLNPGPKVRQLLRVTHSDSLFDITGDEEAALANFGTAALARGKAHLGQLLEGE